MYTTVLHPSQTARYALCLGAYNYESSRGASAVSPQFQNVQQYMAAKSSKAYRIMALTLASAVCFGEKKKKRVTQMTFIL